MRKTSFPSIWDARVPSSTLGGTIFSFQNVADFLTLGQSSNILPLPYVSPRAVLKLH